ncbi:MAG: GNAT family N-acetyltransferase [Gemmatimonadaceae bacterium]
MSDFYRRRRITIKDATALLTFFVGFFWSGAFVWPFLTNQLDQGDMTRGLAYFLGAVLGTAIVAGAIGLEVGNILGVLWERYHRNHRGFESRGEPSMFAWAGAAGLDAAPRDATRVASRFAPSSGGASVLDRPVPSERKDMSRVYYTEAGVYAASFIPLAERVRPDRYEVPRVREALAKTTNIGAWDGARLVGVVRVVGDGYMFSAVADILVDPKYQRLGIGRELMRRALAAAPDARLLIDAPPQCAAFFERIGADRGPAGFVLTPPTEL